MLDTVQDALYQRALQFRDEHTLRADTLEEFERRLAVPGGFVEACIDGTDETELAIKERTKATLRVVLEDGDDLGKPCFFSGTPAKRRALFALAY
jgi:prolyl-tRNA synthetase